MITPGDRVCRTHILSLFPQIDNSIFRIMEFHGAIIRIMERHKSTTRSIWMKLMDIHNHVTT